MYRYSVLFYVRLFVRRLIDDNRSIFAEEVSGLSDPPLYVDTASVFTVCLPKGHLKVICIHLDKFNKPRLLNQCIPIGKNAYVPSEASFVKQIANCCSSGH